MEQRYRFEDLLAIMEQLRGEGGCPWDREQNHLTLRRYLIEEVYELIDELEKGDMAKICDELGDLLLQVVFHASIARESGHFTMEDVVNRVCEKMVTRHTHVFGEHKAGNAEEALSNWEVNKKKEKGHQSWTESLKDIPAGMPALAFSTKVQQKAARFGYDTGNTDAVLRSLEIVLQEIQISGAKPQSGETSPALSSLEYRVGDLLFAAADLARKLDVHPELALNGAVKRFIRKFANLEEQGLIPGGEQT
ncbi:MAG TPA: nucleoside triphosphate pyrophosphohydrolase [Clostridiales bacterium]|nr:nucleoside triphosphate pyrophosphohydrolase [Clostridiales bacterium]